MHDNKKATMQKLTENIIQNTLLFMLKKAKMMDQ